VFCSDRYELPRLRAAVNKTSGGVWFARPATADELGHLFVRRYPWLDRLNAAAAASVLAF
jgi:hypothetical protein